MSRHRLGGCAVALLLLFSAAAAVAQEGILSFSVEGDVVEAAPGTRATLLVRIDNPTVREADDIEATWVGADGFALDPLPGRIPVLSAFQSTTLAVSVLVPEDAALGDAAGALEFVYTYCIDDLCFQIVETRDVAVRVVEPGLGTPADAVVEPAGPLAGVTARGEGAWAPWVWGGVGAVLLCAALYARLRKVRWPLYATLLVVAAAGLARGVALDQAEQAQGIGSVLCTSCVGIEEARTHAPHLTPAQAEEIRALSVPIELLVFYAPWCHACPYAEALVQQAASLNAALSYRFIDVEDDPAAAERHGVIRSGRTVVPAIVRVDSGAVLFGIEDLEARLIGLLKGEE